MRYIFLSTTLAVTLALSGCGSDNNNNKPTLTTSSATKQIVEADVTAGTTKVATLQAGLTYKIRDEEDGDFFTIKNNVLSFKQPQEYIAQGNNLYTVRIEASSADKKTRVLEINVTLKQRPVIKADTTPPHFDKTKFLMPIDGNKTLQASDESTPITYALIKGVGAFDLDGAILHAPATRGEYNITIKATDSVGNLVNQDMVVTVVLPSQMPKENNQTTPTTNSNLVQIGNYQWRKVAYSEDARVDRAAAIQSCQDAGLRLPTASEFDSAGAQGLITGLAVTGVKPFWIDGDATHTYAIDASSNPIDSYLYQDAALTTAFFTCIKP